MGYLGSDHNKQHLLHEITLEVNGIPMVDNKKQWGDTMTHHK